MNIIILTGRLTDEVEVEQYQKDDKSTTVAKFALAVDRGAHEGTDFIPVTVFNGLAATCADQIGKGHQVAIRGELRQSKWTTAEGENRSRLEVTGHQVDFLSRPAATA